jgi:hypothetical protein
VDAAARGAGPHAARPSQRFTGTFADDARTIRGAFETSHDDGATWELDFEITYRKVDA